MYTTPSVLPYGFHITIIINLCLNITWLFLYDRELILAVLITSALMTVTDYTILFFSCCGLKIYGAWLNKHHNVELWIFRILVQNGVAVYATWGTLSTLLNLTIYLQHQKDTSRCDCAMLSLLLLLMELLVWFLLENFYLDEQVRYNVTIYPVVILWLLGVLTNSGSSDNLMYIFAASILMISCILFVLRVALVAWRHHKQPLYKDNGPSLSPVEISLTQRRIFL
ncbi:putative LOC107382473-like protein [Nothobranchius furzeri]|uniref:LOC107382473-like protein n=2 Tax=Nothobranchius furzeri TaxID=105023 RepID=A0A9D2Y397_NOTFU|nr:putative LOC107382473-like protein [Nothobranchius furzeri]